MEPTKAIPNATPTEGVGVSEKLVIESSAGVQAKGGHRNLPQETGREYVQAGTLSEASNTSSSPTSSRLWPGRNQSSESPRQYHGSSSSERRVSISLTYKEALLMHHYTENLGRWLDCSDVSRKFSLLVPEKAKQSPILCQAVLCFAARHRKENVIGDAAYQRCITLLAGHLNADSASHDELLLSAVVILHFAEQLNPSSTTGFFDKPHLAGCSAILRTSQGTQFVDPTAPYLHEAAFWIYVRQSLYDATIYQRPLDIDFSLELRPAPDSIQQTHPWSWLGSETAWANQILWNTANVAQFCFTGNRAQNDATRDIQWRSLWDKTQKWLKDRPKTFDPIGSSPPLDEGVFPCIWFSSDWHAISFIYYHFSCILLLSYQPGPKFAIRRVHSTLSDTERQILDHSRAICCTCQASPENTQLKIVLCHTVFIWGPLVSKPEERIEVMKLLTNFEEEHSWNTSWVLSALQAEWGMDSPG